MTTGYERWIELREREVLGDLLSEREREECESIEATVPEARLEAREISAVERLLEQASHDRATAAEREMVDRALAAVRVTTPGTAATGIDPDAEIARVVDPEGPTWIRPLAVSISVLLPAVAAVALLMYEPKGKVPSREELAVTSKPIIAPQVVGLARATTSERGSRLSREGRMLPSSTDLGEGEVVQATQGPGCIVVDPGVDVCMTQDSAIKLASLSRSHRVVEVLRGRVSARLDPQPNGAVFQVSAGELHATAIGTMFSVELEDGGGRVRVLEGRVKVLAASHSAEIERDQMAVYRREANVLSVDKLSPAEVTREWNLLATGMRGAGRPGAVAQAVPAVPPSTPPSATSAGATPPESPRAVVPSARDMLRSAWELLKDKRWAEAASAYQAIERAHPGSAEAHVVLVRLGDLQLNHLAQPQAALVAYQRYLGEGGGPLEAEARYGKVLALQKLGRAGEERAAIEEFLRAHPSSLKAASLTQRLSELAR